MFLVVAFVFSDVHSMQYFAKTDPKQTPTALGALSITRNAENVTELIVGCYERFQQSMFYDQFTLTFCFRPQYR